MVRMGLALHWKNLLGDVEDAWPVIAGVIGGITAVVSGVLAWRRRARAAVTEPELGKLADQLAKNVEDQWTRGASERGLLRPKPIPVRWQRPKSPPAVRAADAAASEQFEPLPGLAATPAEQLQEGQLEDLHKLYGGLGSGALIIAGAPGSGKSSAAVLLILAALRYRKSENVPEKDRPRVPVPVMFTLRGWNPVSEPAEVWLTGRLRQDYPLLFVGKRGQQIARDMLTEGRVAVILDGLDEIPEDLRPAALEALSQQSTFRLVLLTRSAEMAAAAAKAVLFDAAAIELQDINAGTAAAYLTRTQPDPPSSGWQKLIDRLREKPRSPVAQALNNPLMLTLVRDTYRPGDDASELLHLRNAAGRPASGEDIVGYLLERVLPTAYTQRPGDPPLLYSLDTAQHALGHIAARMNKDGTRDLPWWHVPKWSSAVPRVLATGLVAGLATWLLVAFWFELLRRVNPLAAFQFRSLDLNELAGGIGIIVGLGAGGMANIPIARSRPPKQVAHRWWQLPDRKARQALFRLVLLTGLVVGLGGGLFFGLLFGFLEGPAAGLRAGLTFALRAGLLGALGGLLGWLFSGITPKEAGIARPEEGNSDFLGPLDSWRSDLVFGLVTVLLIASGFGFLVGLLMSGGGQMLGIGGKGFGIEAGAVAGLVTALVSTLFLWPGASQTWSSALGFAQLARSGQTPVRLMRFLEDAHERNVLRTVGPVYQFRHARLQDRLAGQESAAVKGRNEPSRQVSRSSTQRPRVRQPKATAAAHARREAEN